MDHFDRIMNDILGKTASDVLRWTVVSPQEFHGILPVADGVRRVVRADYPLGDRSYQLCFIDSKTRRTGNSGGVTEFSSFEVYVLNQDNQVALILNHDVVDREYLLRLAGLIFEHNDQTKDLFEAFDRSGAA